MATLNEGLRFRGGDRVGPDEYRALLAAVGWRPPDQDDATLDAALRRSWNVTVRTTAGDLVGLARVLDDGVMYASVWDLIVAPEWQRRGIGRKLLTAVMEHTAERRLVSLIATAAGAALYRAAGFAETDGRSTAMFIRHSLPAAATGEGEAARMASGETPDCLPSPA